MRRETALERDAADLISERAHRQQPIREYKAARYSLDFAWPAIQYAIEIDGPHHETDDGAIRDARRDRALRDDGWTILRASGRTMLDQVARYVHHINLVIEADDVGFKVQNRKDDATRRARSTYGTPVPIWDETSVRPQLTGLGTRRSGRPGKTNWRRTRP